MRYVENNYKTQTGMKHVDALRPHCELHTKNRTQMTTTTYAWKTYLSNSCPPMK